MIQLVSDHFQYYCPFQMEMPSHQDSLQKVVMPLSQNSIGPFNYIKVVSNDQENAQSAH